MTETSVLTEKKKLSLLDSAMIIMGSMIGSGIFIVSADISRQVKSPGMLLLVWLLTGIITVFGALSYGELAAMMPKAGGQYIYLKEAYNPLFGFLYGWTLFTVIQTGTIAAVAVAFAKFTGVFFPLISDKEVLLSVGSFAINTQQLVGILVVIALTFLNFRDIKTGAFVQNLLTFTKIGALLLLILLGLAIGLGGLGNWSNFSQSTGEFNLFSLGGVGIFCGAMVGSLFSSDSWNNITFTAGEVKNPQRNLPLSLILGTGTVTLLYLLANVVYIYLLPIDKIQTAESDRVGTLLMKTILGDNGKFFMAVMIMISTFGCVNGLILAGGRVYFAMAKDKLFVPQAGKLNKNGVPANALIAQCIWTCLLTLSGSYGQLLDYVIFTVLIFYILTVAGVFILRNKMPDAPRPYKTFGYPVVPALYILAALVVCLALFFNPDKQQACLYGLGIVVAGIPVYFITKKVSGS
jgi:APA family basic amino acid/polyamine antiporter